MRPSGAIVVLAMVAAGCRTEARADVNEACHREADAAIAGKRAATDGGAVDPGAHRTICEDCCRRHGLNSIEPGYCECGKLGLDALLR